MQSKKYNPSQNFKKWFVLILNFIFISIACAPPAVPPDVARKSVPQLMEDLNADKTIIRAQAAVALGLKGSAAKPAIPALIEHLEDKEPSVRKRSSEALAKIGSSAVPELIKTLDKGSAMAKFYAANALRDIKTPEAQAAYGKYLRTEVKK